jgi:DNA modification methylase
MAAFYRKQKTENRIECQMIDSEPRARIILGDSRAMPEIADGAIDLVVTSPPYWHIKDYGVQGQIGFGQSLHEYLKDLYRVWRECCRVLREGGRLCINIGDQFARATVYGRYKVIPLHAEFIAQGEHIGFDFMGSIIWQKKTTMNTTGGAPIMGSYPYPPNGLVEIDYEHILIFKKPGESKKVLQSVKEASKLTKEEWKAYFAGHWQFGGAKQLNHQAMFPEELPRRLIRMFTFVGDTVLDPFLGSGTTVKAALELGRQAVGYEINPEYLPLIKEKLGLQAARLFDGGVDIMPRSRHARPAALPPDYQPGIQDARPESGQEVISPAPPLPRVAKIIAPDRLELDNGQQVSFLGVAIEQPDAALSYLKRYVLNKAVIIKPDGGPAGDTQPAYIYLKNKIFINAHLIKSGLGRPDDQAHHKFRQKFIKLHLAREKID